MTWFWELEHDDETTEIYPNHAITIGKRSDCTIKTGKRQTATSKNFVTLNHGERRFVDFYSKQLQTADKKSLFISVFHHD